MARSAICVGREPTRTGTRVAAPRRACPQWIRVPPEEGKPSGKFPPDPADDGSAGRPRDEIGDVAVRALGFGEAQVLMEKMEHAVEDPERHVDARLAGFF